LRYVEAGGARLSALGLGTWQFGSREWGYGDSYASGAARDIAAGCLLGFLMVAGIFVVEVALAAGKDSATAWGCDFSYDYVKINADYTSLIVPEPDGSVRRDDRLTRYSPGFKQTLLVEALKYISRFSGTTCVLGYGGEGLRKASLRGILRW